MKYWSLLKESDFLEFIGEYFSLYQSKYHRGQFSGWRGEYLLENSELGMWTNIDEDNYVTEFCISTWANGFDHMKQSIYVRKNTDKTVHQTMVVDSNGNKSWGAIKSIEKIYSDYNQIYDEIHIFMNELYPNEAKISERDRRIKSLI